MAGRFGALGGLDQLANHVGPAKLLLEDVEELIAHLAIGQEEIFPELLAPGIPNTSTTIWRTWSRESRNTPASIAVCASTLGPNLDKAPPRSASVALWHVGQRNRTRCCSNTNG